MGLPVTMHKQYRINVWKNNRLWCRIDIGSPWAHEAVQDLLPRFPPEQGYFAELLVAIEDRRIFESGPDGVRLLACEPIYEPVAPQNTEHLNDSHWQGSRNYPAIAKAD